MLRDPLSPEPPSRSFPEEQARGDLSEKTLLTVKEAAALVKLSIGAVYARENERAWSRTVQRHGLGAPIRTLGRRRRDRRRRLRLGPDPPSVAS